MFAYSLFKYENDRVWFFGTCELSYYDELGIFEYKMRETLIIYVNQLISLFYLGIILE